LLPPHLNSVFWTSTMHVGRSMTIIQAWLMTSFMAAGGCGPGSHKSDVPEKPASGSAVATKPAKARAGQVMARDRVQRRLAGVPVGVTMSLAHPQARVGDRVELSVQLDIAPLWEIRATDAEPPYLATKLTLDLPDGLVAADDWRTSEPGRSAMPDGHAAYADKAFFSRSLRIAEGAPTGECRIKCRIAYQACDDRRCLAPAEIELGIPLLIK
jgi:hypothetical protein